MSPRKNGTLTSLKKKLRMSSDGEEANKRSSGETKGKRSSGNPPIGKLTENVKMTNEQISCIIKRKARRTTMPTVMAVFGAQCG